MSSFDLEAALRNVGDGVPSVAKERLRRQVDDFSMGTSLALPPDPSAQWDPWWVAHVLGNGNKTNLHSAGAKEVAEEGPEEGPEVGPDDDTEMEDETDIEDEEAASKHKPQNFIMRKGKAVGKVGGRRKKRPRRPVPDSPLKDDRPLKKVRYHGITPLSETATNVLRSTGYGQIWPSLPDAFDGTKAKTEKYMREGIVDKNDYEKRMRKIVQFISDEWGRLRHDVVKYESELLEQVEAIHDTRRGRKVPETDVLDESHEPASVTYIDSGIQKLVSDAWKKAVKTVNDDYLMCKGMEMDYDAMPLSRAPDLGHIKTHMAKTGIYKHKKNKAITPWIDFNPSCDARKSTPEEREAYAQWTRKCRASFLVPHLNLAGLSSSQNLMFLIHNRAWFAPIRYVKRDYEACHIGRMSRVLRGLFVGFTGVRFTEAESKYFELDQVFGNLSFVENFYEMYQTGGERIEFINGPGTGNPATNADPTAYAQAVSKETLDAYSSGILFGTGEAHITLLSQAVTYAFLAEVCTRLLALYAEAHQGFEYKLDELPSPYDYPESLATGIKISKAEIDQKSLTIFTGEAFSLFGPHVFADYDFWVDLFQNHSDNALERIKRFFNDPDFFFQEVDREFNCHYGTLRHKSDGKRVVAAIGSLKMTDARTRWDVYYDVVGNIFRRSMVELFMWEDLVRLGQVAAEEADRVEHQGQGSATPEANVGEGMLFTLSSLIISCREYYVYYLNELVCRGKFVASTGLRELFTCVSARTDFIDTKEGVPCLKKKAMTLPRLNVEMKDGLDDLDEDKREVCQAMFLILGNPIAVSIISMKKVIDDIRLLNWDPKTRKWLSNHVQRIIERMSTLVDFAVHLDSLCLARRAMELRGLFQDPPLDSYEGRSLYRWLPSVHEDILTTNTGLVEFEDFIFEEWKNIPLRHYRRIYQWLDEKYTHLRRRRPPPRHSNDEVKTQLKAFALKVVDHLRGLDMEDNTTLYSESQTTSVLCQGKRREIPLSSAPKLSVPVINAAYLEAIRKAVLAGDENHPTSPQPAWNVDWSQASRTTERTDLGEDDMEMIRLDPSASANTASATGIPQPPNRTYDEKSADRYNIVVSQVGAKTLTIPGSGRTRTTSAHRQQRKEDRERETKETHKERTERIQREKIEDEAAAPGDDSRQVLSCSAWDNLASIYGGRAAVTWDKFSSGLVSLGYNMNPSMAGSAVRFTMSDRCAWAEDWKKEQKDKGTSTLFYHRPHYNQAIPPGMARNFLKHMKDQGITWEYIQKYYKAKHG